MARTASHAGQRVAHHASVLGTLPSPNHSVLQGISGWRAGRKLKSNFLLTITRKGPDYPDRLRVAVRFPGGPLRWRDQNTSILCSYGLFEGTNLSSVPNFILTGTRFT